MELKDLMLGDIVCFNSKPVVIDSIDDIYETVAFFDREAEGYLDVSYKKVAPISLTRELLEKITYPMLESETVWNGITEYRYTKYGHNDIEYKGLKFSTKVKLTVEVNDEDGTVRSMELYAFTDKGCFEERVLKAVEPHYLHEFQHLLRKSGYTGKLVGIAEE